MVKLVKNKLVFLVLIYTFFLLSNFITLKLAYSATESILFQNGVNNYNGTEDVIITSLFSNETHGNGITAREGYLRVSNQYYEARSILKFNDIKIPKKAKIIDAKLILAISDWSGGITIEGYYLKTDWDIDSKKLGWKYRKDNLTWKEDGAAGDIIPDKSILIEDLNGQGDQIKTITIDSKIIQMWINNPLLNNGILFTMLNNGSSAWIHSSKDLNINLRPALIIKYQID